MNTIREAICIQVAGLVALALLGFMFTRAESWLAFVSIWVVYAAVVQSIRTGRGWYTRLAWAVGLGVAALAAMSAGAYLGDPSAPAADGWHPMVVIPLTALLYGSGIGFATWIVMESAIAVSRWRAGRAALPGHCAACGYDLVGLGAGAACPECGKNQPAGPTNPPEPLPERTA